jgi:hypothetical protein
MAAKKTPAVVLTAAEEQANAEQAAVGRKAYGEATKALREKYRDEFNSLLDDAYEANGLVSPRKRREANREAAVAAKAAAAVRREERRLAKVAALKAELAALEPTLDDGDPVF